jgi:hypothetical protein
VILLGRICRQLSVLVSGVERLDIEADRALSDSGADADPDPDATQQWVELFAPFGGVRRLELVGTPVSSMASALEQSAAGDGGRDVLQSLESLHLRGPVVPPPIESFVAARQCSGQVVSVHLTGEESPIEDDETYVDHLSAA